MKTLTKSLLALTAATVMTAGANAAVYQTTTYAGQPYVGIKAGQFNVDANNADNAVAYGVYGGYNFTPEFGAELEYLGSSDTDYTDINGVKGQYKASTLGAYGTYRYNFPASPIYAKGKLGVAQAKLKDEVDSSDDTGLAGGIGLGYNLSPNAAVEAEYAMLPSVENTDIGLWTVGAHMKF